MTAAYLYHRMTNAADAAPAPGLGVPPGPDPARVWIDFAEAVARAFGLLAIWLAACVFMGAMQ